MVPTGSGGGGREGCVGGRRNGGRAAGVLALTGLVTLLGANAAGLAQDDGEAPPARPVEIVVGSCEEPGDPVAELTEATFPEGDRVGQEGATVSETSFTGVDLLLDDLLADPHAVVVRPSAAAADEILACGEIGGVFDELGAVIIGLGEGTGSGYSGIAFLSPDDENGQTNVSVFVAPEGDGGGRNRRGAGEADDSAPRAAVRSTEVVASDGTPVVVPVARAPEPTPKPTSTPLPTATPTPPPTSGAIDVVVYEGGIELPERLGPGPAVFTIANDGTEPHGFVMANELYVFSLDEPLAPGETGTLSVNLPPGLYAVSDPESAATEPIAVEVVAEG